MGKFLYYLAKNLFYLYFLIFHHWQVKGRSNRPEEGSLVIMANHISFLDPPAVGSIMNRQVHFMAKEELFKHPVADWALRTIGTFPVKRGKPDLQAIKNAYRILKEGEVLGIFPEGTRHKSGELGKAQPGSIMIPIKTKTPILPVGIKMDDKKLKISIGQPFSLAEYYNRKLSKEEVNSIGELIMSKIAAEIERI